MNINIIIHYEWAKRQYNINIIIIDSILNDVIMQIIFNELT